MRYFTFIVFSAALFFFLPCLSWGQPAIKSGVDRNRIVLGEIFQFKLEAFVNEGNKTFTLPDSIPHFDFASKPRIDSVKKDKGISITAIYELTSFDSGRWSLPPIAVAGNIRTDSIAIDVVFSDFDPQQPYHDIKDIIEATTTKKRFPWWWIAAAGVLLGIIIYYLATRKKPERLAAIEKISAYQEAVQQLERLKKQELRPVQFHSRVVDVFRVYVARKKGIRSLQKTTADLVVKLKELDLDRARFEKLSQALQLSDFVKFAKYEPATEDNEFVWQMIRNGIVDIKNNQKSIPAEV